MMWNEGQKHLLKKLESKQKNLKNRLDNMNQK